MKTKVLSLLLALALCVGLAIPALAASDDAIAAANRLHELGLFAGVGNNADGTPNYDLDRAPTRAEAITLLVRLLGKETEAKSKSWTTPFTDVADWAKPYVGYAYTNGLTSGTSTNTFGGNNTVSATQYLTFVLRALGYTSGINFEWDKAWELTDKLGITNGEYGAGSAFTRGDAVIVSANALDKKLKDGSKILLEAIEEALSSTPEVPEPSTSVNAGKTFTIKGSADVSGQDTATKPVTLTIKTISQYEAVFTYTFGFPVAASTVYDVVFSVDGETFIFGYYYSGSYYAYHPVYSPEFSREDLANAVFTDTKAEDGLVTWHVKLPSDCPFNFDMVNENNIACDVYALFG